MRTIKFRAWWKRINTMQYFDTLAFLNFDGDVLMYQEVPEETPHGIDRIDNTHHLMQYTGLKDKNGKEIYECDILRWQIFYNGTDLEGNNLVYLEGHDSVYFDNGAFKLNRDNILSDYINGGEIEVIGNIYENPELLEEVE